MRDKRYQINKTTCERPYNTIFLTVFEKKQTPYVVSCSKQSDHNTSENIFCSQALNDTGGGQKNRTGCGHEGVPHVEMVRMKRVMALLLLWGLEQDMGPTTL